VTVQAFGFIGQLVTVLAIAFLLVLHGREYVNMGLSQRVRASSAIAP
jgi:hypothetical protein